MVSIYIAGQDNEVVNNMLDANVYGIYNYFSDSVSVYHNTFRGNYGFIITMVPTMI